jgi:hypothetical protein
MAEKPQAQELEAVLGRLEKGWEELTELLKGESAGTSGVMEAEKYVLLDGAGQVRGRLGVNDDGSSGLVLNDPQGRHRAWLGLNPDGSAYLSLKDRFGRIFFEAQESPGSQAPATPGAGRGNSEAPPLGSQAVMARLEEIEADLAGLKELVLEKTRAPATPPEEGAPQTVPPENWIEQLARVERQNRRLKVAGSLGFALVVIALAGLAFLPGRAAQSPAPGSLLEAEALVIRGQGGGPRLWLGQREGQARLELCDQQGQVRAVLGLGPEGDPALALYDRSRKPRAELGLAPDGEPGLNLLDGAGTLRAAVGGINPKYQEPEAPLSRPIASLSLFNEDGRPVWLAPRRWR